MQSKQSNPKNKNADRHFRSYRGRLGGHARTGSTIRPSQTRHLEAWGEYYAKFPEQNPATLHGSLAIEDWNKLQEFRRVFISQRFMAYARRKDNKGVRKSVLAPGINSKDSGV